MAVQWLGRRGEEFSFLSIYGDPFFFSSGFNFFTWEMQTSSLAFIWGADGTRGA